MTLKHILAPSLLALSFSLAACNNASTNTTKPETAVEKSTVKVVTATPKLGTFGIATKNMDRNIDPGNDFYRFVNGSWLENTEIPSDRSRFGIFNLLADQAEERVKSIIETAAASENPTSDQKRIADYYNAFMDIDAVEAAGISPIKDDLARIKAAKTHKDIARLMADPALRLNSVMSPFIGIDAKQNDNYIVQIRQSGLGLRNPADYTNDDEKSVADRAAYKVFLATMLSEAGLENSDARAKAVYGFEKRLAAKYWTPLQRRDRDKTYNKLSKAELIKAAPGMPWQAAFDTLGIGEQDMMIVREKSAIIHGATVFKDTPVEVLRDYLTVSLLSTNAAYLPKKIDMASFEFFGKQRSGQKEQRPRWKRGVGQINGTMGEIIGKVYVAEHFPPESKTQMQGLVENLRGAFREGIDNLEWMGADTKKQAQYKLAKFNPKIGYPDEFEAYDGMEINRNDLYGTVKSIREWGWNDSVSQLGGPIDRNEWGMNPQRVNAYYNSVLNEIVFPAAILDAPFFDPNADAAVNYGGIGAVIGHEMGHGFDDQGRKSDGDGVQRDWWTAEDAEGFKGRAQALADQYSAFEPLPNKPLNGKLGLGENIGDLTGITMAYNAYRQSLGGKEAPVIDGFTGDQRFFMAWAQVWAVKWREAALAQQIKNGPHSPGEFRANGAVRNFQPWYDAFDVKPGDALYLPPEKRVKIW